MLLDLYFHHQNSAPKSGVNRMWLVEYYTQAWAEKEKLAEAAGQDAPQPKRKPGKKTVEARRAKAVQASVDKAEADLDALTRGLSDVVEAQRFTQALIQRAQLRPAPETDFLQIAKEYREKQRRDDDEMLLLSMVI